MWLILMYALTLQPFSRVSISAKSTVPFQVLHLLVSGILQTEHYKLQRTPLYGDTIIRPDCPQGLLCWCLHIPSTVACGTIILLSTLYILLCICLHCPGDLSRQCSAPCLWVPEKRYNIDSCLISRHPRDGAQGQSSWSVCSWGRWACGWSHWGGRPVLLQAQGRLLIGLSWQCGLLNS